MSNPIPKLPTGDNNLIQKPNPATMNIGAKTPAIISQNQVREAFNPLSVSLGANSPNSDITRRKDKSAPNSDGEKTDWKRIKQGTDSDKTSKTQGKNSSEKPQNSNVRDAKQSNTDVRENREKTPHNNAEKSNNGNHAAKSKDGNDNSAAKNSSRNAAQNNENRDSKSNNQPRAETSNNGNRNSNSAREGGDSAGRNNETNRASVELRFRSSSASQSQSNKAQVAADASVNGSNRAQVTADVSINGPNRGHGRGKPEQSNQNPDKTSPDNRNSANAPRDAARNTPLFNNRNQASNSNAPGRNAANSGAQQARNLNLTVNVSIENNSENYSNSRGNRQNGFLGEVIRQVFRESDVYLSRNAVKTLIEQRGENVSHRPGSSVFEPLPKEIQQLVRAIENQVLHTPDRRQIDIKYASNRVNIEISPELDNQIRTAKNLFTQIFGTSDAKQFSQMNIQERMLAAVEIFFKNLPAEMPKNLQHNSVEKVLAGFLLARGLVSPDKGNSTENLLEMMQTAATDKVSLAAMRDFGGLVKVLISDAASAKSTANLEIAVQKFARILTAINCLDAVLTAVKLASQSQFAGGNVGRTLAIVQVYELINRLVLAGQNAMREAAEAAQKNAARGETDKNSRDVFPAKTVADLTETDTANKKTGDSKNVRAESALRNFLEFNPMYAGDKSLSAFDNADNARQAQRDFLDHHQIEIEQWLRSGNHRLVKDINFEKPIGIVVERNKNDFLSATTARIVLVRDGSAQGWHFLKSFLVA